MTGAPFPPGADGVIRVVPWVVDDAPAGVYFAVLRAGAETKTRKLVVTR